MIIPGPFTITAALSPGHTPSYQKRYDAEHVAVLTPGWLLVRRIEDDRLVWATSEPARVTP